jgi:hypothetical protein
MPEPINSPELIAIRKAKPKLKLTWSIISLVLAIIWLSNGSPSLGLPALGLAAFLGWRSAIAYKLVKDSDPTLVSQVASEAQERRKAQSAGGAVIVKYQAGLESFSLRGNYGLLATTDCLLLTQAGRRIEIPWNDVEAVDAGSEGEIRSRMTLTRVALFGVFALGAKKEKKQDFFVTITTKDSMGMFVLVSNQKNNKTMMQAKMFSVNCTSKIRGNVSKPI